MARDAQTILDKLRDLAPRFLTDSDHGDNLLEIVAGRLSAAESRWKAWFDQAFRQTAEDPYLTDLGEDRGAERHPWESDEEYRDRAFVQPKSPTPHHLEERVTTLLEYDGYEADLVEPFQRALLPADTDHPDAGVYLDTPTALTVPPGRFRRCFWVALPIPEVHVPDDGIFLTPPDADDPELSVGHLGATPEGLERRIWRNITEELDTSHPASTAYGESVDDSVQVAHLANPLMTGAIG